MRVRRLGDKRVRRFGITQQSGPQLGSAEGRAWCARRSASGAPIAGLSGTDAQGFVGHSARCDAGSTPAAAIRTANSLAIVCETAPGSYYYRGERLSDGAQLQLANAVPAGGGFDAVNPADGSRYQVRPDQLTISSSRGSETDPALEYGGGR